MQNQLETEQIECRRLVWANRDAMKERELEMQRYERDLEYSRVLSHDLYWENRTYKLKRSILFRV